jgi:uncharacterized damage-inducible protein DinB
MISPSIISKINEQIERSVHLAGLVPPGRLDWRPPISGAWSIGEVLGHLLDCMAGFCAVLYAAHPEPLRHFVELQRLPVNHVCGPDEAARRIRYYILHIDEGFALLKEEDLDRKLPTVFVSGGETLLMLLLGNLEHLINHKHQLFMYLKLMAVNVATEDLYQLRG